MNTMDNNPAPPDDNIDISEGSGVCWCMDHTGDQLSRDDALERSREFHGHTAPCLVVGVRDDHGTLYVWRQIRNHGLRTHP